MYLENIVNGLVNTVDFISYCWNSQIEGKELNALLLEIITESFLS